VTKITKTAVKSTGRTPKGRAPAVITLPHNNWKPRVYQEKFWEYFSGGGKRGVAVCHRRWGKDELMLNWTGIGAHERTGTYWHLLPEAAQGRKAIWQAVNEDTGRRRIDEAFPEAIRASTNENEMFIRFKCGSTWQVVGSDNYNSLVGSPPVGVCLSEWPLANPSAWAFLAPVLERNGGWAAFVYTPRGKNHGYKFYQASQTQEGWHGELQGVQHTNVFSEKQLESIKSDLIALYGEEDGENLYNQEYLCSFSAAIFGAYYARIISRLEQDGRITAVPYNPNYPVYTAWDLGYDDATAIWFAQIVGREIRIIDCYEQRNRALVDIARDVLARPYVYAAHYLPHDVEQHELTFARTRRETLEGIGLRPIHPGTQRDVGERINAVRNFLPLCVFDQRLVAQGLEALRSYHVDYDEKNRTPRKTPKHDWSSHFADAFGELAMQLRTQPAPTRQAVTHSDYDIFGASQPGYAHHMNAANPNPIPNKQPEPQFRPSEQTWDPFA